MIDIHTHIIPSVDDGSKTIFESMEMIKKANQKGVKTLVATPHYTKELYEFTKKEIEVKVNSLNEALKANGIDTKVLFGQEVMIDENTFKLLEDDIIGSINNSRYILIEFEMSQVKVNIEEVIKEFVSKGYVPIIAHPERYKYVQNNVEIVKYWIKCGALLQMNLGSASGAYGKEVKKTITKLLKKNLIHLCGSDIHHFRDVYECIDAHVTAVIKIVKKKKICDDIFINNSFKVISNEEIIPFEY